MSKAYASTLIATAMAEVGYREKATNSQLESKTANAGSRNYTKYAAWIDSNYPNFYNGRKNGYSWCDVFNDYCYIKSFGLNKALELLCQPLKSAGAGCKYSYNYFKAKNQVGKTPKKGAQIFFGSSVSNINHTGIVYDFDKTYVYTIEGNSGNMVSKRKYSRSNTSIVGYGYPKFDPEPTNVSTPNKTVNPSKTVKWSGYIVTKTVTPRVYAGTKQNALKSVGNLVIATKVEVCDTVKDSKNANWYYIRINKKVYGFVPVSSVSKTHPTTTSNTLSKKAMWTGVVTASKLNVRSWAGTTYSNIKAVPYLYKNNKIKVCDTIKAKNGSNWYYVLINGKTYGFVSSTYIKKV